jgi:hypothetical protein
MVETHKSTANVAPCSLEGLALVAILSVDAERAELSAPCIAVIPG